MTHTSGKHSKFDIGDVNYDGKGWAVDANGSEVRTDNTSDGGFSDRIVAMKDAKITLEFDWDCSKNLMSATPNLSIGTVITNLKLLLDSGVETAPYWLFPKAIVLTTPMSAKVGETIKWTVTLGNKGSFTPPTGTFAPSAIGAADA